MVWHLFLDDDSRTPDLESFRYPPNDGNDWKTATSSAEAIKLVETYGAPSFISFDHDLGLDDTSMVFVKWLYASGYEPPNYTVHSRNGEGAKNLVAFLESWKKVMEDGNGK